MNILEEETLLDAVVLEVLDKNTVELAIRVDDDKVIKTCKLFSLNVVINPTYSDEYLKNLLKIILTKELFVKIIIKTEHLTKAAIDEEEILVVIFKDKLEINNTLLPLYRQRNIHY